MGLFGSAEARGVLYTSGAMVVDTIIARGSFPKSNTAVELIDSMIVRVIPIARTDGPGVPCHADDADIVAVKEEIEGLMSEGQCIDRFAS